MIRNVEEETVISSESVLRETALMKKMDFFIFLDKFYVL